MSNDLYRVLGVSREAGPDELKKAFRKLAKTHHPDRNPGDPKAEARFKEISRAFEVLSNPERRAAYDEFGEASLESGFDVNRARAFRSRRSRGGVHVDGGFSMDDLLGELFGGQQSRGFGRGAAPFPGGSPFTGGSPFPSAPAMMRADLSIDFRTAAQGGERELQFSDGSSIKVRIPPGVRDSETIRLPNQGPGGADIGLTLHVGEHPVFRREGEDLHIVLPVTIGEAIRGASVTVPTLDGTVKLYIPAGTQSGARLRLRGKGITRRGVTGDLYAELLIEIPTTYRPEIDEAVSVIERSYGRDVRAAIYQKAAA